MPRIDMLELRREIRNDEGCVLHAYEDSLGYLTIGVGRLIDKRKGGGLSQHEVDFLLDNDLGRVIGALDAKIPWLGTLPDKVQRALVNMAFQLGTNGLLNFKNMLAALKNKDFDKAAEHALNSTWAKQTPERAQRIAATIREGK